MSHLKLGVIILVAALIVIPAFVTKAMLAQQSNVPGMLPGDVLYVDNTTAQPYLLWHANTNRFEVIAPYTQDQCFHLLLMREQAVWDTYYWFSRSTIVKPPLASMPGRQR